MVLAIDIGNTTTAVGLFDDGGTLRFRSDLSTHRGRTRDECAMDLMRVFGLYHTDVKAVTGTILSSVVPPVTAAMCGAAELLTGKAPLLMGPGVKTGLNIRSDIHTQMGTDIVACSVAAIAKYPGPIILIDMGTAIAISVLVGSTYEGCILMPGVQVALDALSNRAAELPHISIAPPADILGHNTVDAMRSGAVYGNAAMVDGMIERIAAAGITPVTVVGTGSAGAEILHYCKHPIQYDPDLLLDGLHLVYRRSTDEKQKRA